ncbi:ATP-binding cassette sub-family G member 1 [Macrosteles quadrilineatus]|uniref:ATP-binding cassette sub-family G member 1 n=1 Tax=Macrosteles quadrilineatus TaxID=74068 RepID=UPI0023E1FC6E|nr:ATP-binding cassette sub-family G member 1 [Macrosteles quadrilineatus]XP_054261225.1 ATP-binding cassette sub-family G member 1 [Macrosteles quadrilineatus]
MAQGQGTNDLPKSNQIDQIIKNNNYQFHEHHFPKRPTLDLTFKDITYTTHSWSKLGRVKKQILHGVSGEFRSGELTAIMGPSGAGKSTLLNILAAFTMEGSTGSVMVNGQDRSDVNIKHYLRVSCYIQQDDELRPLLSVEEAMMMAAHLKLGYSVSNVAKCQQITELLSMLGLSNQKKTLTGRLSGGQKRRLSIALELITNPPLIFLDEPTTGLDSSSTSSCVQLLRDLAREGRTVVCTIHQPSALVFEKFDHLYAVAGGRCLYQGPVSQLVPRFASHGLVCPRSHNPADFLIEVAVGEYGKDISYLVKAAAQDNSNPSVNETEVPSQENGLPFRVLKSGKRTAAEMIEYSSCQPEPAPLWAQSYHLYARNIIILRRSLGSFALRFVMHILIALLFGYLYRDVGESASTLMANYIFVYGSNLFLHYTGQMAVSLAFPLEFKILLREYFNRWYSLAPYCLSVVLIEVPFQLLCACAYLFPAYYLTGQPMESMRFGYFLLFNAAISLTAQGYGFMIGATLPVGIGVFIGPVLTVFLSVFGFTSRFSDIPSYFHFLYHLSYFRASFQGSFYSLYGFNRSTLACEEYYCHFKTPSKFLKEMEFNNVNIALDVNYILLCGVVFYILTIYSVWYKLNKR